MSKEQLRDFFQIYQTTPGYFHLWAQDPWAGISSSVVLDLATTSVERMSNFLFEFIGEGRRCNLYYTLATGREALGQTEEKDEDSGIGIRSNATNALAVCRIGMDIDVVQCDDDTVPDEDGLTRCPNIGTVEAILKEAAPPCSWLVMSGGGVHAYWDLKEPVVFTTVAEAELFELQQVGWHARVREVFKKHGYRGDKTSDLARVLKVPFAPAYKKKLGEQPRDTTILSTGSVRYTLKELAWPEGVPEPAKASLVAMSSLPVSEPYEGPSDLAAYVYSWLDHPEISVDTKKALTYMKAGKAIPHGKTNVLLNALSMTMANRLIDTPAHDLAALGVAMCNENVRRGSAHNYSKWLQMIEVAKQTVRDERSTVEATERAKSNALFARVLARVAGRSAPPPVPEEARGATMSKDSWDAYAKALGFTGRQFCKVLVLKLDGQFFLWDLENCCYLSEPISPKDVLSRGECKMLMDSVPEEYLKRTKISSKNQEVPCTRADLLNSLSEGIKSVKYFLFGDSGYDVDTKTLRMRVCKLRTDISPLFIPEVDRWLRLLAGADYDILVHWIVMSVVYPEFAQSILTLIGPTGSGKTLLAKIIAMLFEGNGTSMKLKAATQKHAVDRINSPIINCDESISDPDVLKEVATASDWPIEFKGLNKVPRIYGTPRTLLSIQNKEDLVFKKTMSSDDIAALKRRLLPVTVNPAAAGFCTSLGGESGGMKDWVTDKSNKNRPGKAVQHFMWLVEKHKEEFKPMGDFLTKKPSDELEAYLASSTPAGGALQEIVAKYVAAYASGKVNNINLPVTVGQNIIIGDGKVLVHVSGVVQGKNVEDMLGKAAPSLLTPHYISAAKSHSSGEVPLKGRLFLVWKVAPLLHWAQLNQIGDAAAMQAVINAPGSTSSKEFPEFSATN